MTLPVEDSGDFLAKVDIVTDQINALLSGKTTPEAFDKRFELENRKTEIRAREKFEAEEKEKKFGRPGQGTSDDYVSWCRGCFTEFMSSELRCARCNYVLISREERKAELSTKVADYREELNRRKWRKDRYVRWEKTNVILGKKTSTDYASWDQWEPPSDEEDRPAPILPKNDLGFQAMEKDFEARDKKREEQRKAAEKVKFKGNEFFNKGDLFGALNCFEEGLVLQRDNKHLWTNKALVELKIGKYKEAEKSATAVIDLCELLESGWGCNKDLPFKAFSRRGLARKGLKKWVEAAEDFEKAMEFSNDKELIDLISICKKMTNQSSGNQDFIEKWENAVNSFKNGKLVIAPTPIPENINFCIENSLEWIFNKNDSVFIKARKKEEISDFVIFVTPFLLNLCKISDAAADFTASNVTKLFDLFESSVNQKEFEISIDLFTILVSYDISRKSVRKDFLKKSRENLRKSITYKHLIYSLSFLCNLIFGATEEEKNILRDDIDINQIQSLLSLTDVNILQKVGSLLANLAGSNFAEQLSEHVILAFIALSEDHLNINEEARTHLLNALHNYVNISEKARVAASDHLSKFCASVKIWDARSLTILLRLASVRDALGEESEAVLIAQNVLKSIESTVSSKDAAIRLIAHACSKDSAVLNTKVALSLVALMPSLTPTTYVKSGVRSDLALIRANTSLLLGQVADRQALGGMSEVDLSQTVYPLVAILRMEEEAVQKNAGIALSKIARIERYKEAVRKVNGFESLAQIQLKLIK